MREGFGEMNFEIEPLGDSAVLLRFGEDISRETNELVQRAANALEANPFKGMQELIPAFSTLAVEYSPSETGGDYPYEAAAASIREILQKAGTLHNSTSKIVRIPVCYEPPYALDLEELAMHTGLTVEKVISLHTAADYYVYFLGFAPGFPFLGGMREEIAMPRKSSPREKIPAGSVGIAGGQTGVYPIETPGGWQIIGRTPATFFSPEKENPVLVHPGDTVQFYQITIEEYNDWEKGEKL
jgi:inhibitor of KinA